MGIYFDGGERLQRGRGIGGLLKLASKLFSPLARVAKKALQSNTGKKLANAVKEQAIESSINVASDLESISQCDNVFQYFVKTTVSCISAIKHNLNKSVNT